MVVNDQRVVLLTVVGAVYKKGELMKSNPNQLTASHCN